ncbi:hypothetical protein D3C80_2108830 [compost metagenome]
MPGAGAWGLFGAVVRLTDTIILVQRFQDDCADGARMLATALVIEGQLFATMHHRLW